MNGWAGEVGPVWEIMKKTCWLVFALWGLALPAIAAAQNAQNAPNPHLIVYRGDKGPGGASRSCFSRRS